jgi:hypothetical protein
MAASVDEPVLNDHRSGLVAGDCAGMRTHGTAPHFRVLDAITAFRLHHASPIRRMDDVVRVAMGTTCASDGEPDETGC